MATAWGRVMDSLPAWTTDITFATGILAAFIAAFLLSTRLITTLQSAQQSSTGGASQAPPVLPYWIPFFKSSPSFWRDPVATLEQAKESLPGGIFSVQLKSQTKTYIYSRALIDALLGIKHRDSLRISTAKLRLLQNGFDMPFRSSHRFLEIWPSLEKSIDDIGPQFGAKLEAEALKSLERQMPDLISFSTSQIDAHQWERVSGTVLLDDKETVETGLVALIQTFLAHFTTNQLLSPSLFEQTPDLVALLLTLPSELDNLLTKPRAATPRAAAILRTLTTHVQPFLDAVYAPADDHATLAMYDDLPDANTPFMTVLRTPSLVTSPAVLQISLLLYLLTLSIASHALVPWALLRLHAPFASARRRHAAAVAHVVDAHVAAVQKPGIGAFRPPPEVSVGDRARGAEALNALLAESVLALARGSAELDLAEDVLLSARDDDDTEAKQTGNDKQTEHKWQLKADSTVVLAHWLEDRELQDAHWSDVTDSIDDAVQQAFEQLGDFHLPALSSYLKAVYIGFIATFLKLYDIQPADPKGWSLPPAVHAAGIALPKHDVRVRIRSRNYDLNGKEVRAQPQTGVADE